MDMNNLILLALYVNIKKLSIFWWWLRIRADANVIYVFLDKILGCFDAHFYYFFVHIILYLCLENALNLACKRSGLDRE
jgi:hypothetical protein